MILSFAPLPAATGAIVAFAGIRSVLLNTPFAEGMYKFVRGSGFSWLLILGGFMVGQWIVANAADLLNFTAASVRRPVRLGWALRHPLRAGAALLLPGRR